MESCNVFDSTRVKKMKTIRTYCYKDVSAFIPSVVATMIKEDEIAEYAGDVGLEVKNNKVSLKISQN